MDKMLTLVGFLLTSKPYPWGFQNGILYICFQNISKIVRDESDENNCKMLVQKENYNKKVSPFQYDYLNDIVIPVDVKISVAIMDILSIQEIELVYIAKFRLLMEWYDYR